MQLCSGALARWSALLISAVKLVESQRKPIAMRSLAEFFKPQNPSLTVLSSWIGADSPRRLLDRATSSCSVHIRKFGQSRAGQGLRDNRAVPGRAERTSTAEPSLLNLLTSRAPDTRPSVELTEQRPLNRPLNSEIFWLVQRANAR